MMRSIVLAIAVLAAALALGGAGGALPATPGAEASSRGAEGGLRVAWLRFFDGTDMEEANAVATAPDGSVYVTGYTLSRKIGETGREEGQGTLADVFLVKYSAQGELLWTEIHGGGRRDVAYGIAVAADGSVYLAGSTQSENLDSQVNQGATASLLMRYSPEGDLLWTRLWGSPRGAVARGVAVAEDGSLYVTGYTAGDPNDGLTMCLLKYNEDGSRLWTRFGGLRTDAGNAVAVDREGAAYVAGGGHNQNYAFLAKYNASGQRAWLRTFGRKQSDLATGVAVSPDGAVFVGGSSGVYDPSRPPSQRSGSDMFLGRFTMDGEQAWLHYLDPEKPQEESTGRYGGSVAIAAGGSLVYTVGSISPGWHSMSEDILVAAYSLDGRLRSTTLLGGETSNLAAGVAAGSDGSVYVTAVYASQRIRGHENDGGMLLAKFRH